MIARRLCCRTVVLLTSVLFLFDPAPGQDFPRLYQEALNKFENADYRAALHDFRNLQKESGRRALDYYIGFSLFKLGEYAQAEEYFRRATAGNPGSWEAALALGRTLFHLDRLDASKESLDGVLRLEPSNLEAGYHLGLIARKRGDCEAALAHFLMIHEVDRFHLGAIYNAGQCYARLKDSRQARFWSKLHKDLSEKLERLDSFRKAASYPTSTDKNFSALGSAYLEIEEFGKALEAFQRAFDLAGDARLMDAIGFCQLKLGRLDEAAAAYERFLGVDPSNFQAFFNYGHVLKKLERRPEGKAAFLQARRLNPGNPTLHLPLVELLLEAKRWGLALTEADRVVERFPGFAPGHVVRALSLMELGRLIEARRSVDKALELGSDPAGAEELRSEIQRRLGE